MSPGRALGTSAPAGIWAQLARALAADGVDLVLVARSERALHTLTAELRARHSVPADVLVADLTVEHAATTLREHLDARRLRVDPLINNAGSATTGRFEQINPAADHAQVMLNAVAVVHLTHQFLPTMAERGHGAWIHVASIGARRGRVVLRHKPAVLAGDQASTASRPGLT